jgi:hypothetical protein
MPIDHYERKLHATTEARVPSTGLTLFPFARSSVPGSVLQGRLTNEVRPANHSSGLFQQAPEADAPYAISVNTWPP